jgi:PAS domain S-box-containing protein
MARQGDSNRQVIAVADDINTGTATDNRERAHLETLDLVTNQMAAAVTRCSRDLRYLWVNQAYADWLRCPLDSVIGRPISDVLGKAAFDALLPQFTRVLTGESVYYEQETDFRGIGARWVSAHYTPTFARDGAVNGWVGVVLDITDRKRAEAAVKDSEARFRAREELLKIFVKSVPAGVAMLDREMRYLQVSDRFCADYGIDGSAIIGRSHYDVFPDIPERWKDVHRRALSGETIRADEDRWEREHGTVWVQWEILPWKTVEGVQGGILIFAVDISRHKQMEDALRDTSRKLVESQEQERTRIGRELHDDISQRLAMLTVEVDDLNERFPPAASERRQRLARIRQRLVDISSGVQSLSQQLYSPHLELIGLAAAMRGFCRDLADGQKVDIQFEADTINPAPAPDVSLCLLRVLQEALHNAVKHSRVRRFDVKLACSTSELDLRVGDEGAGFDLQSALKSGGMGLSSMIQRVRLINGTISIDSKPLGGTTIRVRAPLALPTS